MKLLIIEDDKDLSSALQRVLKIEKYDVDAAYDGIEGLDYINSSTITLNGNNNYASLYVDNVEYERGMDITINTSGQNEIYSSNRNTGLELFALLNPWIMRPGIEPI